MTLLSIHRPLDLAALQAALREHDPRAQLRADEAHGGLQVETRLDEATVRAVLARVGLAPTAALQLNRRHGGECCGGCSGG